MNKLFLIGNLTKDPELRSTKDGTPVCSFTVAVNRKKVDNADFFRVTAWRQLGEICARYLAKGRKVSVVGSVSVSTYTGQDGQTRASMDVTADDVEFLSPKGEESPTVGDLEKRDPQSGFVRADDDQLPWEV